MLINRSINKLLDQSQAIIITGPTASGKSSIAIEIAKRAKAKGQSVEIINADSLLIYRDFNIGTAKPNLEEKSGIPHHLIDIRDPLERYDVGQYMSDVKNALSEIHKRGNRADRKSVV